MITADNLWTLAVAGLITLFAISALVGLGALVRWVFRVNDRAIDAHVRVALTEVRR